MSVLVVDATSSPRTYRIYGGGAGNLGGILFLALLPLLAWFIFANSARTVLDMLSPGATGDLPWVLWGLNQALFGSIALVAIAVGISWLALLVLATIALCAPGSTSWHLDGVGLSAVSGVGPFSRTNAIFIPFESIAGFKQHRGDVTMLVWRDGCAQFGRMLAEGLSEDDAGRLASLLGEDHAVVAREWADQGLQINRNVLHPDLGGSGNV